MYFLHNLNFRVTVLRKPSTHKAAVSAAVYPNLAVLPFLELQAVQLASTLNNYTGEIDMAQSAIFLARATALKVGSC